LSLPCWASSWRMSSMRRRASSSSKRPARAAGAARAAAHTSSEASRRAAAGVLFTRVLDIRAAVLCPRGLVVTLRLRLFLAIAHGLDASVAHAQDGHHLLDGLGAALAQREVVLAAAALVAIAFDADVG